MINALHDKQSEATAAFQAKWEQYQKTDKAWRGWLAEQEQLLQHNMRYVSHALCKQPHAMLPMLPQ